MLTYVTWAIGSGKTALMLRLNDKLKREGADGFVCPKVYYGGEFQGYDLVRLGDSGRVTFARLGDFYEGSFPGTFAKGALFQVNEATGDKRISGSFASLAGLEQAEAAGDLAGIARQL